MILILIALAVVAAVLNDGSTASVINAVAAVWALGVMGNFRHDQENVPGYAVALSMLTTIASLVLLAVALI